MVIIHEIDGEKGIKLIYNEEKNIWYQQTIFSTYKEEQYYQYENDHITIGIRNAGTIAVSVIRNNQLLKKVHIHFVPSSLKMIDYEEMIADLYRIREELVRDEKILLKLRYDKDKLICSLRLK